MSKVKLVNVNASIKVKVPQVPNFLLLESKEPVSINVGSFTDACLKRVAAEWTRNLIERAREIREGKA